MQHEKGTVRPRKFKMSQLAGKLTTTVFWTREGLLLIDYKEKSVSITGVNYATILERLKIRP